MSDGELDGFEMPVCATTGCVREPEWCGGPKHWLCDPCMRELATPETGGEEPLPTPTGDREE